MPWIRSADTRHTTAPGTALVAITRSWCSEICRFAASRYRPGPTFSSSPDLAIWVSAPVWIPSAATSRVLRRDRVLASFSTRLRVAARGFGVLLTLMFVCKHITALDRSIDPGRSGNCSGSGGRRAGQGRDSGERCERTLDAPKPSRKMTPPERRDKAAQLGCRGLGSGRRSGRDERGRMPTRLPNPPHEVLSTTAEVQPLARPGDDQLTPPR